MVLWLLKKISMGLFMGKMLQAIYFKQFNKICRKTDKAKKISNSWIRWFILFSKLFVCLVTL